MSAIDTAGGLGLDPALVERFRRDLAACGSADEPIGIAVSGGPDSIALLLLARAAMPGLVRAATVDHGLRSESADEARCVAQICTDLAIEHEILAVEVPAGNLQHGARTARYGALSRWARRHNLAQIATAHHADDQAETVLMRLNRGGGIFGLAGIRRQRPLVGDAGTDTGVSLVRPLLGWRRAELAQLCKACAIEPIDDPSNHNPDFQRVLIRQRLADNDWLDSAAIARSADHLREAIEYLDGELTDTIWAQRVEIGPGQACYFPVTSRFANVEIVNSIMARLGSVAPRSEIATMVDRLMEGQAASLTGILARADKALMPGSQSLSGPRWSFAPEPPRRTG